VSEGGPRLIIDTGLTEWSRKMAHQGHALDERRSVLPGSAYLEELRRGNRDRLYDVSATDPLSPSARPDVRTNGHSTVRTSSPVAPVAGRISVPDVRYLIIDDCKLNRENLGAMFAAHGCSEPAMAWDLPSLCAALGEAPPEIVLLNMSTRDRMTLLRLVRDTCPEAKMIVVGISDDDESEIVACAEAGVSGYHLRAESLDDLLTLMSRVPGGESLCSPKVSAILLRRLSTLASQRQPEVKELVLTAREIQILRLLESGLSNQEIADRLCIALHTVKNHVHSVLGKLGVSTRGAAAAYSRSIRRPELAGGI
jgi:DNA-binding NarL/FixJ family response regulator